mmetsp:Transcript_27945/g.85298  ORF Transcript_27945/g.85298 Transcript_27945/m.85298 type:complete len:111 (+) Transcript_27945:510-842(+)
MRWHHVLSSWLSSLQCSSRLIHSQSTTTLPSIGSLLVSGRLLKVYAPDSPALAFLYRTDHPLSKKCSGWGAVHSHDVENFEVSTHVPQGAHAYHFAVPAVIEEVALLPCN